MFADTIHAVCRPPRQKGAKSVCGSEKALERIDASAIGGIFHSLGALGKQLGTGDLHAERVAKLRDEPGEATTKVVDRAETLEDKLRNFGWAPTKADESHGLDNR